MSVFGGDSSWRKDTPGAYMLDVVRAAGSFGDSFQKSFEAAADRKDGQQKFDKKLTQDAQQFRDKFIEEQRQFDIIHPDPLKPWQSTPVTAPPINTPPPALMPSPGYDQQFKQPATPSTFGMFGYAEGGRPAAGEPSVVGERGPEVFVPDRPGTIVPNDEIGMRYDRNGTGSFTPTTIDARWDGSPKPTWLSQPVVSWRATNAVDAVGKVTQAQTFADLTRIQAENPEAGMYPQFQNALRQKSMVLERGEAIALRQKQVENNSVAAKSALDLNKRFNSRVLQLPDSFHVAVRALGDAGRNPDGTPSLAAMQVLEAGEAAVQAQREAQAKAAELALTRIDARGGKTYSLPGARGDADAEPMTKTLENGVTLAWMPGSKGLHQIKPTGEKMPVTAYQLNQIAKSLGDDDPDKTNFLNMAKSLIKGTAMPKTTNAPAAAPAKAATQFTKGQRAVQGGITYEFDGSNWNPVK